MAVSSLFRAPIVKVPKQMNSIAIIALTLSKLDNLAKLLVNHCIINSQVYCYH